MSRRISVILSIIAAILLGACSASGGNKTTSAPINPTPSTTLVQPVTTSSVTAAPVKSTAKTLRAPVIHQVCGLGADAFCASFPTSDDRLEIKGLDSGLDGRSVYSSGIRINSSDGSVCPNSYADNPNCVGFDQQLYHVGVLRNVGTTADAALTKWQQSYLSPDTTACSIRRGTFLGQPALFSATLTSYGAKGTCTAVWRSGAVYDICAQSFNGTPKFEKQFVASFRFK